MHSEAVQSLMFDFQGKSPEEIECQVSSLPNKLKRWVAINHPDNRIRTQVFRMTGISIGEGTVINSGFIVSDDYEELLTIGERVAISPNVCVICSSSPNNSRMQEQPGFTRRFCKKEPIHIGDDSWIGTGAVILPGANIGSNVLVGAGAVVDKDVEDFSVVAGVPATRIRSIK